MGEYYHLLLLTKLNILLYFLMNHLVVDNFENEDGETKYNSKANNDEQEYSALNIIIKDILVNKLMPFRKISELSAVLEPVFGQTEKSCIASNYRQFLRILK